MSLKLSLRSNFLIINKTFISIRTMSVIPKKKFNNGQEIPCLGLGTYKEENESVLVNAIKSAIRVGYRHFDCAPVYYNEKHVGRGLREAIEESNGSIKRQDLFITSKLWCTFFSKERVPVCLETTLNDLGLDYLDLYLVHWPMGFKEGGEFFPEDSNGKTIQSDVRFLEAYKAMENLVKSGKVKSIGVSNFNIKQLQELLDNCEIKPVCNQFEIHPLLQNKELVDFCHKNEIQVVAYSPFGAPDRSWLKPEDPIVLKHSTVLEIAKRNNKTLGQVILRWLFQRNIIAIPKSVNPERIEENSKIFDFELSKEDMEAFNSIKEEFRFYGYEECDQHPDYPFKN